MAWDLLKQGDRDGARFELSDAEPLLTMACHCTGCQTMSSSAFSLSVAVPAQGFAVTEGEAVLGGLHGRDAHHYFCPHCVTWMFTKGEGMDWFVNVRPTLLEDAADFAPYMETWLSEKLPFAQTSAVRSFDALPPLEDYEGLLKEFSGWAR